MQLYMFYLTQNTKRLPCLTEVFWLKKARQAPESRSRIGTSTQKKNKRLVSPSKPLPQDATSSGLLEFSLLNSLLSLQVYPDL